MSAIQPSGSAYILREQGDAFYLLTPGRKHVFVVVVASVAWLCFFRFFPIALILMVDDWWAGSADARFPAIMAILGSLMLIGYASYLWLRLVVSRQLVLLSSDSITIRQVISLGNKTVGLTSPRSYPLGQVSNLRVFPAPGFGGAGPFVFDFRPIFRLQAGSTPTGRMAPVSGRPEPIRFGLGLNETEVREVWLVLEKRFPLLATDSLVRPA